MTAPTERHVEGVRTHRSRHIQLMVWRGIPIATGARALVDIAGEIEEFELGRACHEAGVRYRTTPREVGAVLASYPTCPGASKLRGVMRGDTKMSLSRLE